MQTSRRQSSRIKSSGSPIKRKIVVDSGEEESDCELTRPKKRVKRNGLKSAGPEKAMLSMLPSMPLDILFQVFMFLTPADLISLTRVSTTFRDTLLRPSATTVWKATREQRGQAPAPPQDFTEPRWCKLLFGGNICEICGSTTGRRVDYSIRRRLCRACFQERLVDEREFSNEYPQGDGDILDLVTFTYNGSKSQTRRRRYFMRAEIEQVTKEAQRLRRNSSRYNEYIASRKEFVSSVVDYATLCIDWSTRYPTFLEQERKAERKAALRIRRKAIVSKLRELGYDEKDAVFGKNAPGADFEGPLTDRAWSRIRADVEEYVQKRRKQRLHDLICKRFNKFSQLYSKFCRTLKPEQEARTPLGRDIARIPAISALLHAPPDVSITTKSFKDVIARMPEIIASFFDDVKKAIGGDEVFDFAASVVTCNSPGCQWTTKPLFVWDDVMRHQCVLPSSSHDAPLVSLRTFAVHSKLSDVAKRIIKLAGLDPRVTTTTEMLSVDLKLVCKVCKPANYRISGNIVVRGKPVYQGWRACIRHASDHVSSMKPADSVSIMRAISGKDRIEKLFVVQERDSPLWTCNHCWNNFSKCQRRSDVVRHLMEKHNIIEPKEPEDLLPGPGATSSFFNFLPPTREVVVM